MGDGHHNNGTARAACREGRSPQDEEVGKEGPQAAGEKAGEGGEKATQKRKEKEEKRAEEAKKGDATKKGKRRLFGLQRQQQLIQRLRFRRLRLGRLSTGRAQ